MQRLFRSATLIRLSVFLLVLGAGIGVVHAGQGGCDKDKKGMDKAAMTDRHVAQLAERLDLTAAQEADIRSIFTESFERRAEARERREDLSRKEWRAERQAMRQDTREQIREVLTEDQRQAFREMRKEHRKHHHDRHGHHGHGKHKGGEAMLDKKIARMSERLELTEEQEAEVREIFADSRERGTEVHQRKDELSREELRAEFQALHQEMREQLSDVLTDEQLAAYREMRQKHHRHHRGDPDGKRGQYQMHRGL